MDKIKELLSKTDYCRGALAVYLLKCLIISVGFADALILAIFAGIYAFQLHLKRFEKKDPDIKLREEINEIKAALTKTSLTPQQQKKPYKF